LRPTRLPELISLVRPDPAALGNPEYMALLVDGKASLEELFAQIEPTLFAGEVEPQADTTRMLPGFRKIINLPTLPEHLLCVAAKTQQMARSN